MVHGNRVKHVPGAGKLAVDDGPSSGVARIIQRPGSLPGTASATLQSLGVGAFYRRPSRPPEETPADPTVRMLGALYRIALAGGFR